LLSDDKKKESKYYNLDAYYLIHKSAQRRRGRAGRIVGKFTGFLDGFQGLFIGLLMLPLTLGTFVAVVFGASLGPIGFIAIVGSIIVGLTFFVERKVGKSVQVGNYSLLRGAIAVPAAFAITIGVLYMLLFLGRL
jgi:hypothetical protein